MEYLVIFKGFSGPPGIYDPNLDERSTGPMGPQGDVGEMGFPGNSLFIIKIDMEFKE